MYQFMQHIRSGLVIFITLIIGIFADRVHADPYLPSDDAQIMEQLPNSVASSALTYLQTKLARQPEDMHLALSLAQQHIEQARLSGDPRHLGRAEAALAPWWNWTQPPVPVLVMRAILRQANHEFDAALADLGQAVERDPGNAQAWLTRASIFQARGDYFNARKDCHQLQTLNQATIASICQAEIASLNGNAALAHRQFQYRLEQLGANEVDTRRWLEGLLADSSERLGDSPGAEAYYRAALAVATPDLYLLTTYADFLLDRGRFSEVITLLDSYQEADAALLRLVIAAQQSQHPKTASFRDTMQARFDASRARGSNLHRREEARFALEVLRQPVTALTLARANWDVQREPADARVLLQAALAAEKPAAAQPVLHWLRETGLEDRRLVPLVMALRTEGSRGRS